VCSIVVNVECPRVFLPKQQQILETTKRFPFYSGAVGAGKSLLGCNKVIRECLENPHSVWLCASQTYPQLRDTVLVTFLQELDLLQKAFDTAGAGVKLLKDYNRTELKIVLYNGSTVLFRSCEDYSKFKSLNLDGFFIDEPVDVSEDVFDMLVARLRSRHTKHHFGLLAGNPANRSHWLYRLYFEHPPSSDYFLVHTSTYDNIFLESNYIKSMEEKYDEDWTRRYLKGEWFNLEGLIYPEFSRDVHVGDFKDRKYNSYRGSLDWGFRNPSCFLLIARDGDDSFVVVSELYQSGLTTSELAGVIRDIVGPVVGNFDRVFCDPSMPAAIEEIGRFVGCVAADNNVLAGISKVKALLRQKRLFIDQGCVNLIRELESYHYVKESKGQEFSEQPCKVDDHATDSLRYGCFQSEEGGTCEFILE